MKLTTAPRNKKLAKTDLFVVLVREGADLVIPGRLKSPPWRKIHALARPAKYVSLTQRKAQPKGYLWLA